MPGFRRFRETQVSKMRAKFRVSAVTEHGDGNGNVTQETVRFNAVGPSGNYPEDGSDENNTFAKFTPSASCEVAIMNPALIGQFKSGDEYYVDFTKAEKA